MLPESVIERVTHQRDADLDELGKSLARLAYGPNTPAQKAEGIRAILLGVRQVAIADTLRAMKDLLPTPS